MIRILVTHVLLTVIGSLLLWLFTAPQQALSYFTGSILILTSFIMFGIGFGLIFKKKFVALAISIIVFKYAILGIIIYTLVRLSWFDPLWFALGVASFALSAIIYAVRESLKEGNDNVI